ncbi:MAG: hypothetical protein WDA65_03355 [Christensenellales bacterium]
MTKSAKKSAVGGAIISLTALLSTVVFLYIGFVMHTWHPTWLIFISIPVVSAIVDVFTSKRHIAAAVSAIVSVCCVVAYLYMGFILRLWHPGWLIFFAIPITHIILKLFTGDFETCSKESDCKTCSADTKEQAGE